MGGKSSPKDTEKSLCPFPQTVQYKCHLSPCPVSLALLSLALPLHLLCTAAPSLMSCSTGPQNHLVRLQLLPQTRGSFINAPKMRDN